MKNLYTKVKKYLEANSKIWDDNKVTLQDDMIEGVSSPYIKSWSYDGLAKPTDEQLATYNSAATTEENNNVVIANRISEYGSNTYQIENIIENGLSAEQTRVQTIKDKYPKE